MTSHPKELFTTFGSIALVVGERQSARSTFIRSLEPKQIIGYYPKFSNDRKSLITELGKHKQKTILAIETELPAISEKSDTLLKELSLLAKIRKHIYLIEWKLTDNADPDTILYATYAQFVPTIVVTYGLSKEAATNDSSQGRFSSIGTIIKNQFEWFLEYSIIRGNSGIALQPEHLKYDVTHHVPKNLIKETDNAKL